LPVTYTIFKTISDKIYKSAGINDFKFSWNWFLRIQKIHSLKKRRLSGFQKLKTIKGSEKFYDKDAAKMFLHCFEDKVANYSPKKYF